LDLKSMEDGKIDHMARYFRTTMAAARDTTTVVA
jgi:hypothetical protein